MEGFIAIKNKLLRSKLTLNSIWGIIGNLSRSVLQSLFYLIIARAFDKEQIGKYFIALAVYNLLTTYSSLGLGQWFAREYLQIQDKKIFTYKYFKILLLSGCLFFFINIGCTFFYHDFLIKILILITGVNILFDNIIYGINNINIVEYEQSKSVKVLFWDSFLKCFVAIICMFFHFSLIWMCIFLVGIRFLTLNLMFRMGKPANFSLNLVEVLKTKINKTDINRVVIRNWAFIIITGLVVANWKMCSLVISKMLPITELADFEMSFRIYSIIQIFPTVIVSTAYPKLAQLLIDQTPQKLIKQYESIYSIIMGYCWLAISIYYVLARFIVPLLFGKDYDSIVDKSIYMVLAVVPQSIILLQSRLFIASNKERIDMLMNLLALIVNVVLLMILLSSSYRSLEAVNFSIFTALTLVVLVQDYLMVKYRLAVSYLTIINYGLSFLPVIVFCVLKENTFSKSIIVTTTIFITLFFLLLKKILLDKQQRTSAW